MELTAHDGSALFVQPGLRNDDDAVEPFMAEHHPLPTLTRLDEAPFRSPMQARELREMLRDDSDGAVVVDALSTRLRRADRLRVAHGSA